MMMSAEISHALHSHAIKKKKRMLHWATACIRSPIHFKNKQQRSSFTVPLRLLGFQASAASYLNWALMLLGLEERVWTSFSCFSLRILSASR